MAENRNQNQGNQNQGNQNQGQSGGGAQGKLNLNNASKEELRSRIEGVGENTANDIVSYREKNGGFKSMDDLRNIGGIDDEMEAKIRKFSEI